MASKKSKRSKRQRRKNNSSVDYSTLEQRLALTVVVGFDSTTGIIQIDGDGNDNTVDVFMDGADLVVQTDDTVDFYSPSVVNQINFSARNGNDAFYNETSIPTRVLGQGGDDYIISGEGDDYVHGGNGNDYIEGKNGADEIRGGDGIDTIKGHGGDDTLYGGAKNDIIFAGPGDDFVNGEFGDDTMYGHDGNDTMLGFSGVDTMEGGDGDDLMYGQAGDDTMNGDLGNDRVRGNPGNDILHGNDGDDVVMGDQDDDMMYGDDGNDTLIAFDGADKLYGGNGNDRLYGQNGEDELFGERGNDIVRGGNGDDILYGGRDNDSVIGDAGNDRLFGEEGVDFLNGGDGNDGLVAGELFAADRLKGGAGSDRFLVQTTPQVGDLITDAQPEDATINFLDETSIWTPIEMEIIDNAFAILHERTGDTTLLKDSIAPGDLTFYKYQSLPVDDMGGFNDLQYVGGAYTREIHIAEWIESSESDNDDVMAVTIRQIAHNWDSVVEQETQHSALAGQFNTFKSLSDWQETDPGAGYTQSTDMQWFYDSNAAFDDDHARTNPFEDFAMSFEYYFRNYENTGMNHGGMQGKYDFVDNFLDLI